MGSKVMTNPMIKEHNVATGEVIERELNAEELAQHNAYLAEQDARKTEQTAKDAARQAVLDKLGLSADEVAALLG
jgi:hypothetical protein